MGKRARQPPKIFHVNWFRTDDERQVPVAGLRREPARPRVDPGASGRRAGARATAIGSVPTRDSFDLSGLDIGPERFEELVAVDPRAWAAEAERNGAFLDMFGSRLPEALRREHRLLAERLHTAVS